MSWRETNRAESAERDLVEDSLRFVVSVAERYRSGNVHILKLIPEGNSALLDALKTFRDSTEESFWAHAQPFVERAIAEAASSLKRT